MLTLFSTLISLKMCEPKTFLLSQCPDKCFSLLPANVSSVNVKKESIILRRGAKVCAIEKKKKKKKKMFKKAKAKRKFRLKQSLCRKQQRTSSLQIKWFLVLERLRPNLAPGIFTPNIELCLSSCLPFYHPVLCYKFPSLMLWKQVLEWKVDCLFSHSTLDPSSLTASTLVFILHYLVLIDPFIKSRIGQEEFHLSPS